jgi:hypothetical protein
MSVMSWVGVYMLSVLVAITFAFLTRKKGYGSSFPSAASAIAMNCMWPLLVIVFAGITLSHLLDGTWQRVEDWWDGGEDGDA